MTKNWSPPSINTFERLLVTDGLLVNSYRWKIAHEYHRQRQNVHFQSLNQPGIVCGLEVCLIKPPTYVSAKHRDLRWVQLHPGIAIDLYGNLIVVPKPIDFRIKSEITTENNLTVYLVVYYVDPEELSRSNDDEIVVTEKFRIKEKDSPPSGGEVEVCRIQLTKGEVRLEAAPDVFNPRDNQLDLRYRIQARSRPQSIVRTAILTTSSPTSQVSNLSSLLQSVASLYPSLAGDEEIGQLTLLQNKDLEELSKYDLLYLREQQLRYLPNKTLELLQKYTGKKGGVLLVEASPQDTKIGELVKVKQELQRAKAELEATIELETTAKLEATAELEKKYLENLEQELEAFKKMLAAEFNRISQDFKQFLKTELQSMEDLSPNDSLRTQPFLFDAFPVINNQGIPILSGGGVIVVLGNLSSSWGLESNIGLSRETIRTAQEIGINILHFAWRRRQLTQSQIDPINL